MKREKKHKWKYQVNIRKKIVVLVVLGVFLFVGLGYSILGTSLGMHGTIEVSKKDKSLYSILLREYNDGYAAKYSGNHQDSMDSSKSTYDIYHFYAANNDGTKAGQIREKNNVLFGDRCWQLYRTTDTGGVRLIYNGKPEVTESNGVTQYDCGTSRNRFQMGELKATLNLNGTYIYAKNYTATTNQYNNTTFTLVDDPDDPDDYKSITVNGTDTAATIADIVANYPYTCRNNNGSCNNYDFYKVDSQKNGTEVYAYKSALRDGIGMSSYADAENSLTYVGYMYGDVYPTGWIGLTDGQSFDGSTTILWSTGLDTSFWYADNIDWNNNVSGKYTLDSPYQVSSTADYANLVGKYTFRSSDQNYDDTRVYYIAAVNGNSMIYRQIANGETISQYNSLIFGDDLIDNGNGTYSLDNASTPVTLNTYYNNHANYRGKYTCGDSNTTCTNPKYITNTNQTWYNQVTGFITIAKTKTGLVLDNPTKIHFGKWYTGYNTTYADYVYTCGNTDTTCTNSNLRYIYQKNNTNYRYAKNYNFGSSVVYDNGLYKLQNIKSMTPAADLTEFSTHHYVCSNLGATECSSVLYIYSYSVGGNSIYVTLNNSNIDSIQDVLDAMLTKNTTNSAIKNNIDTWYSEVFENTQYESKIDDTIYCNDRSFDTRNGYTFAESGWNDDGGYTNKGLYFKEYGITSDLSCTNVTDRFSVSNNQAKLTYPIALPTTPEMNLIGNSSVRQGTESYWLMSPLYPNLSRRIQGGWVDTALNYGIRESYPLRPAISLVKEAKYTAGDGSSTDPYIVDVSN